MLTLVYELLAKFPFEISYEFSASKSATCKPYAK